MTEEVAMFDRIINRITRNRRENRELRANDEAFKTMLAAALGDAAPEGAEAAGFVAGVESLRAQQVASAKQIGVDSNRIAELIKQRESAYDAERAATSALEGNDALIEEWKMNYNVQVKRADDLLAEQQLIAEKLGLLETDDEPADAVDAAADADEPETNLGGQTASEVAAEIEGQAMTNANRKDQA